MAKTPSSTGENRTATHKAFVDHIGELRTRLTWVALVFIVTSAVAYNYRDFLVHLVLAPLGDQKLVYLTPAGGFSFIFQITMYAGAVVTAPLLIYHLYKFVVPALPKHARRHTVKVMAAAISLMLAGVAFGYFVAVPAALQFLTTFAGSYVEASLTADSYLNFILAYVAGLGILFQLPLLLVFWNWISPLGPGKLMSSERFIIVFAFVAAAIMTPTPDIMNQALIAVPIIAVYQLGVIAVLIANHSSKRKAARHQRRAPQSQPMAAIIDDIDALLAEELAAASAPKIVPEATQSEQPLEQVKTTPLKAKMVRSIDGMVSTADLPRAAMPIRNSPSTQRGAIRPPARVVSTDGFL